MGKEKCSTTSYAVDLDKKVLDYAKILVAMILLLSKKKRLHLIYGDSLDYMSPKVDIVSACNLVIGFSRQEINSKIFQKYI